MFNTGQLKLIIAVQECVYSFEMGNLIFWQNVQYCMGMAKFTCEYVQNNG